MKVCIHVGSKKLTLVWIANAVIDRQMAAVIAMATSTMTVSWKLHISMKSAQSYTILANEKYSKIFFFTIV